MTDAKAIDKGIMLAFLENLIERFQVWAPVSEDGIVLYKRIDSADEVSLDFINTQMSAKELFFPQTEVLFSFDGTDVEEPAPPEEIVLFGVRPCDLASLRILDAVFDAADYPTFYYGRRRETVRLIGMACSDPYATCFCTDLDGGPSSAEGSDLFLSDLGSRYLVETVTERGKALLEGMSFLEAATASDLSQREQRAIEVRERIRQQITTEGLKEKLDELFDGPVWDSVYETCLGCGTCTYSCPTCHCFDIVDEADGDKGRRLRIWDSCQYPLFTHHTSGHNPRPFGKARFRQRVMHKFHYLVENQGIIGCVGCGRCIRNCPVSHDIREVLNRIMER